MNLTIANFTNGLLTQGTHAARPAAGTSGRMYFETDTLQTFWDNGSAWVSVTGGLLAVQKFTSGGTYTPTAGTVYAVVEAIGAGGGGGGAISSSTNYTSAGSGGGGGGYGVYLYANPAAQTVTVPSGGSGGSGAGNGGSPSATTFGALLSVNGGGGGTGGTDGFGPVNVAGGAGGTGAGSYSITGSYGGQALSNYGGIISPDVRYGLVRGGHGGNSNYGFGGDDAWLVGSNASAFSVAGNNGSGYGGGGGGAAISYKLVTVSGGSGTGGIIIVHDYG